MGDVKMLAMIGAFLGWKAVLVTLVLSSFSGALVGIGLIAFARGGMRLRCRSAPSCRSARSRRCWSASRSSRGIAASSFHDRTSIGFAMGSLTAAGYALFGITAVMGLVLLVLLASMMRMSRMSRNANDTRAETTMMSVALQEALTRLKAQERATAARAEASERLSSQIITGVGAGLIVVDRVGVVQIVNPAARRILSLDGGGEGRSVTDLLSHVAPLAQVITDTLSTGVPVVRRPAAPRRCVPRTSA